MSLETFHSYSEFTEKYWYPVVKGQEECFYDEKKIKEIRDEKDKVREEQDRKVDELKNLLLKDDVFEQWANTTEWTNKLESFNFIKWQIRELWDEMIEYRKEMERLYQSWDLENFESFMEWFEKKTREYFEKYAKLVDDIEQLFSDQPSIKLFSLTMKESLENEKKSMLQSINHVKAITTTWIYEINVWEPRVSNVHPWSVWVPHEMVNDDNWIYRFYVVSTSVSPQSLARLSNTAKTEECFEELFVNDSDVMRTDAILENLTETIVSDVENKLEHKKEWDWIVNVDDFSWNAEEKAIKKLSSWSSNYWFWWWTEDFVFESSMSGSEYIN